MPAESGFCLQSRQPARQPANQATSQATSVVARRGFPLYRFGRSLRPRQLRRRQVTLVMEGRHRASNCAQLQHVMGQSVHVSPQSTFHGSLSRKLARLRRSREAKTPSAMGWHRLCAAQFLSPQVLWMVPGQDKVSSFLLRRRARLPDRAGGKVLLAPHSLVCAAMLVATPRRRMLPSG